MHRELDSFYFDDNVVIVELSLNPVVRRTACYEF